MKNDTTDVLKIAADIIRENGWSRGRMVAETGEVCVLEALQRASGSRWDAPSCEGAYKALLGVTGASYGSLGFWNDAQTSVDDVLKAFELAIHSGK